MIETAISFWTDIQRYEDMLEADPNSYCFAPLSELYRKLGLLDDAIAVAQKGCARHPEYPGGFLALASACAAKGLKEEARQALVRVVTLAPENLQARKQLGQIYADMGETQLAVQTLQQVVAQDPADTDTELLLRSLGSASAAPAEEEEVLEELEVIEDLTDEWGAIEPEPLEKAQPPRSPLSTATMAELYARQGFPDKALLIYRELLSEEPGNAAYRARVAQLQELIAAMSAPAAPPKKTAAAPAKEESGAAAFIAAAASAASAAATGTAPAAAPSAEEPSVPAAAWEETEQPLAPQTQEEVIELLEEWLENIRRKRHAL